MIRYSYGRDLSIFCLKSIAIVCILFFVISQDIFSQESHESDSSPQQIIKKYKEVLKTEKNPEKLAEAHYNIGYALERLGRETEATAEYLKVMISYPDIEKVNKMVEERLGKLYSRFQERARDIKGSYTFGGGEKDPTIFFAYIKSLYENYRQIAMYKRALSVLEEMYNIDPENPNYIMEIGDIYLEGFNNPEKAILYYKKAIKKNPRYPPYYIHMARAYELTGKYEEAVKLYRKVIILSPASQWAMYSLRRIEGINLTEKHLLIKDWFFIGPFDNTDKKGLEKIFPPEREIAFDKVYKGKNGIECRWFRPYDYDSFGYVNLKGLFKKKDYAVAYALTYVYSPRRDSFQIRTGSSDGLKVWINDKVVIFYNIVRNAEVDDDLVVAELNKGWNKILVKISQRSNSWGFYFRITDLNGNPVQGLVFDPLKDENRVRIFYNRIKNEMRLKMFRNIFTYGTLALIFIFGLYFMVSNIYTRIKINRMKEDFVSSVSHDLKTPIAAIKMFAETLRGGRITKDEMKVQYYDMIIRESDRLTRFINKILDFSKMERGKIVYSFEKENIVDVAHSAVEIFKTEVQDEMMNLSFNAEDKEIYAEVDKDAIMQVLLNLIDNAYKYSKEEKKIDVTVRKGDEVVFLEVADNGLGIPKDKIEKIFDKFYRMDREISRRSKGSGLGLAFVKNIINAHNGEIAVESELGKGSRFIISLPVTKS